MPAKCCMWDNNAFIFHVEFFIERKWDRGLYIDSCL